MDTYKSPEDDLQERRKTLKKTKHKEQKDHSTESQNKSNLEEALPKKRKPNWENKREKTLKRKKLKMERELNQTRNKPKKREDYKIPRQDSSTTEQYPQAGTSGERHYNNDRWL